LPQPAAVVVVAAAADAYAADPQHWQQSCQFNIAVLDWQRSHPDWAPLALAQLVSAEVGPALRLHNPQDGRDPCRCKALVVVGYWSRVCMPSTFAICQSTNTTASKESANKKLNAIFDKEPRWLRPKNTDDMGCRVNELSRSPTRSPISKDDFGHSRRHAASDPQPMMYTTAMASHLVPSLSILIPSGGQRQALHCTTTTP
jgi:hypothetical protein